MERIALVKNLGVVDRTEWLVTGGVELALVVAASVIEHEIRSRWPMSLFAAVLLWYGTFVALTLVVLRIQRHFWPIAEGRYSTQDHQGMVRRWKFHQFLTLNNLFFHYQHSLLPPPVRKFFSRMLGAEVGNGIVSIGGVIIDPYLITIAEGATIGHDSLLLPCHYGTDALTLGRISVGRNAVVGARSLVEHGVTIGEGAMVKAMSRVEAGTTIAPYEVWGGVPARKMGSQPPSTLDAARFSGWRDLVVTPLVQFSLLAASGALATWLCAVVQGGLFEWCLLFYFLVISLTLLTLKAIRTIAPFPYGQFTFEEHPNVCYRWNLYSYLCITHLFLHYQNGLVPIPLRKLFCWFLGTEFKNARGLLAVAGHLTDHHAITIAEGAVIGVDSLLLPHAVTVDSLILEPVTIERGAVVGARTLIMPGVLIGENSYVSPMSLVTFRTQIPANQWWGGVPARKLGDLPPKPPRVEITATDVRVTALPLLAIVATSGFGLWLAHQSFTLDLFCSLVVFCVLLSAVTAVTLKILRMSFPLPDGTYSVEKNFAAFAHWKRMAFIAFTCLTIPYQFGLIPPILRKPMLRLMGARIARQGPGTTTGFVTDPDRFEMGSNSVLQINCVVIPAHITPGELHLGHVRLADSVSVGPLTMVLPGVTIGSHATVEPMSLVDENTHIPAGETWGGIPARRR